MDHSIFLSKRRFVPYPDTGFSYAFLKSDNFFKLYVNLEYGLDYELKPSDVNTSPYVDSNFQIRLKLSSNFNLKNILLEGVLDNTVFYITDILVLNNEAFNHNYRTRIMFIKKFLDQHCIEKRGLSMLKYYHNTDINNLVTDIVHKQNLNFKPKYIYFMKNLQFNLVPFNSMDPDTNQEQSRNKPKQILNSVENPEFSCGDFEVFSTDKPEIYVVFDGNTSSLLRIKTIKDSRFLEKLFKSRKTNKLFCTYNSRFKKYELNCV